MCPQSVITCGDTQTSHKVIGNSPHGGLEVEGCPVRLDAAIDRHADDEGDVQPMHVLVPICPGDWSVGNVRLLWVIFGVSIWL